MGFLADLLTSMFEPPHEGIKGETKTDKGGYKDEWGYPVNTKQKSKGEYKDWKDKGKNWSQSDGNTCGDW